VQRDAEPLGEPHERDSAEDVAVVAPLITARATAADEALALVEVQRRDRHACPFGELAGRELALPQGQVRHVCLQTSSLPEVWMC
jgi:hypothetical protein